MCSPLYIVILCYIFKGGGKVKRLAIVVNVAGFAKAGTGRNLL